MITQLIWTPMSSVPQKADKLNLSLSYQHNQTLQSGYGPSAAMGDPYLWRTANLSLKMRHP